MECIFCNRKEENIIKETDNFFVYVGKGLITAGHIMIIPKDHYDCLGSMEIEKLEEYELLKNEMIKKIEDNFSKPFLIEHGVFCQSVFHAHIHLIPSSVNGFNNINIIEEMVLPSIEKLNIPYKKITSPQELKEIYNIDKQYLYFEQNNEKYVLNTVGFTQEMIKDYLLYRLFFTNKKNLAGIVNWKTMTEKDIQEDNQKKIETLSKLR